MSNVSKASTSVKKKTIYRVKNWATYNRGQRSDALVELSDKAPTLLELCRQQIPENMTGKSLAPMLTGQVAPDHHQSCSICDGSKSTRRDRPRIQQPVLRTGPSRARAPRSRPALH
ncbi:MAG: hypothetical protein HOL51_21455 [Gemmatimonadetes bacterium]|jgi:hypothetical protein|nr:hypothetical protein [Gemmatimonadota bacterium]MBT5328686.1 hypothetical protein [Gemmatimonadota bacterium]MBT5801241.1 hypothetical protein [Gemmatimonadota bacterium]MBT7588019.1 hypothetical protein [Gemmatimonadota bacterium]